MNSKNADLGNAPVGRLLFSLAAPAIAAQLINLLYNIVDRMYIGHMPMVGPEALTGVGVCGSIIMCVSAFASLAGMGGAPRAAIMMGKKDEETAQKILGNCTTLLICVAITLTLVIQLFGKQILLAFGASENTLPYAWDYIQIYSLGTIFVQLSLGLNAFINTQGFAKIGMMTVLIGAVTNIILDPVFIFVCHMGVRGAALATIISQAISCGWILRFLTGPKTILRIAPENMKLKKEIFLPCVALGLAPFIMQFTESALTVTFNRSLIRYGGDIAVGAMSIQYSVYSFSMLPLNGLAQGAQPIMSYNFGAGNFDRVKKVFWLMAISAFSFSSIVWSISEFAPGIFVGIFTSDPALTAFTCWSLRIYAAVLILFSLQIACQQSFVALGNAKTSLFLALFRKVFMLIPLIYIMPVLIPSDKVFAVFLAEPIADFISVSTALFLFSKQYRKLHP